MFFRGWVHVLLGTQQGIHLDNFQLKLKFKLGFNKLTVNGTKSSEIVHSDLGDHSDGGGAFRFSGVIQICRFCCGGEMSVCLGFQNNTL